MNKNTLIKHLRFGLISALGFGIGMPLAVVFLNLIKRTRIVAPIKNLFESQHLLIPLILVFLVVALGGAIVGALGGLALSYADGTKRKKEYISKGALGFATSFALVLYPLIFLLSTFAFYSAESSSPLSILISFSFVGAVFGFVSNNILGIATYGRSRFRFGVHGAYSFGLAGALIALRVWYYFYELKVGTEDPLIWLIWFALFGVFGGFSLGIFYSFGIEKGYADDRDKPLDVAFLTRKLNDFKNSKFYQKRGFWGTIIFFGVIFLLSRIFAVLPFGSTEANLSSILDTETLDTHWSEAQSLLGQSDEAAIFATDSGLVSAVWAQDGEIYLSTAREDNAGIAQNWTTPKNISESDTDSATPQIVIDSEGSTHIIWMEEADGTTATLYLLCAGEQCATPSVISAPTDPSCGADFEQWQNQSPSLAISPSDEIMLVWGTGTATLPYTRWQVAEGTQSSTSGCVSGDALLGQARVSANPQGGFSLVYTNIPSQEIYLSEYKNESWGMPLKIGVGENPEVFVNEDGANVAWCDENSALQFWQEGQAIEEIAQCLSRPAFAEGENLRLVWYADSVENIAGEFQESHVLFESENTSEGWATPAIVALPNIASQPFLASGGDNHLHLLYKSDDSLEYAAHAPYSCEGVELSLAGQNMLDVAQSGRFHSVDYQVPYCRNQFDRLIYAPNPLPEFSEQLPADDGTFEEVARLIETAEYEVVYSTMWYDAEADGNNPNNPGVVVAGSIKKLYDRLEANPEQYPRGIRVKILLDNPPELTASKLISQIWNVFNDLRSAGVPTMSNPEIGWDLQVANYAGSWPHGHTKMVIVDGKNVTAAGFNFQYAHFPEEHDSKLGQGRVDLGLEVTGPVAQSALRAFDDLWLDANRVSCPNLGSTSFLWWISCSGSEATVDHAPEVLRYYLPETGANAFTLHRTEVYKESDDALVHALESAEESIDIIQVNFTFDMICDLNILLDVCDYSSAPPYIDALMTAIEDEQAYVRILIEDDGIEGFENKIAMDILVAEVKARGLSDYVEVRYFTGLVHAKTILIDDELLIVGSQNFHYSAFGEGGLTEFNIATDSPQAVEAYKSFFDYYWEQGTLINP